MDSTYTARDEIGSEDLTLAPVSRALCRPRATLLSMSAQMIAETPGKVTYPEIGDRLLLVQFCCIAQTAPSETRDRAHRDSV